MKKNQINEKKKELKVRLNEIILSGDEDERMKIQEDLQLLKIDEQKLVQSLES